MCRIVQKSKLQDDVADNNAMYFEKEFTET
jgi:hypothetical protein